MDTPMTFAAGWLNDVFAPFDLAALGALHALAEGAGFALTPLFEAVSFVGEKGACFFALALVLVLFKRTRKAGVCVFVALCLGALASNVVLKDLVARPRPFESSALYLDWWRFAGAAPEDGFSFPSGHMTAASAATVALMLASRSPKAVLAGTLVIAAMGAARCYLVAHYPSDVLAALLVGSAAAAAAYLLVDAAWRRLGSARLHARDVRRRVARVGQVPAEVVGVDGAYAVQARARAQSQPQHVRTGVLESQVARRLAGDGEALGRVLGEPPCGQQRGREPQQLRARFEPCRARGIGIAVPPVALFVREEGEVARSPLQHVVDAAPQRLVRLPLDAHHQVEPETERRRAEHGHGDVEGGGVEEAPEAPVFGGVRRGEIEVEAAHPSAAAGVERLDAHHAGMRRDRDLRVGRDGHQAR